MGDDASLFSESWHRVAGQRIHLRRDARVRRQFLRGERWFVVENPMTGEYFRLRPDTWDFVARLSPRRTVEEVWRECLERFPESAPGQEAVVHLLAQLYQANLLEYVSSGDAVALFQRHRRHRRRSLGMNLANIMFLRIPLWNPDAFLRKAGPVANLFLRPWAWILWLAVVGHGVSAVLANHGRLGEQAQGILAPANLGWLYLCIVGSKLFHEMGHAFLCRRFGGPVTTLGVMLLVFTPAPYVDVSSSWGFSRRRERLLVASGGMIFEFFLAAIAASLWAAGGDGVLRAVCFNLMFIASVSTLLFNLNPLMRFDGYFILSDLLGLPNLSGRSQQHLVHLCEKHLFGLREGEAVAEDRRQAVLYTVYGVAALVYRTLLLVGILWFIADKWLLAGLILTTACVIAWVLVPLGKFIHYLTASPRLARVRVRAVAVVAGGLALVLAFLGLAPMPHHFRAQGLVQSAQWSQVVPETGGRIHEVLVPPGQTAAAGQILLRLENPEAQARLIAARHRVDESEAALRVALSRDMPGARPLRLRLEEARQRVARLETEVAGLDIRARHEGVWIAPDLEGMVGSWIPRGAALGALIDTRRHEFVATVEQADVDRLFAGRAPRAEVRLRGLAAVALPLGTPRVVPAEQIHLPSPALGWAGGGSLAVDVRDGGGTRALTPYFAVVGALEPPPEAWPLHGRTGVARFALPPEPLLVRWTRHLRQLFLQRFSGS